MTDTILPTISSDVKPPGLHIRNQYSLAESKKKILDINDLKSE